MAQPDLPVVEIVQAIHLVTLPPIRVNLRFARLRKSATRESSSSKRETRFHFPFVLV